MLKHRSNSRENLYWNFLVIKIVILIADVSHNLNHWFKS